MFMSSLVGMKRQLHLILLFLFLISGMGEMAFGQSKKMSKSASQDNPYAWLRQAAALPQSDAKQALELIEKALLSGLKSGDLNLQADAYKLLGKVNEGLNQFDLATENYTKASQFYSQANNNVGYRSTLYALGKVSERAGKLNSALSYYRQYLGNEKVQYKADSDEDAEVESYSKSSKEENSNAAPAKTSSAKRSIGYSTIQNEVVTEEDEVRLAMSGILAKQKRYNESIKMLDEVSNGKNSSEPSTERDFQVNTLRGDLLEKQDKKEEALQTYFWNAEAASNQNKLKEVAKANDNIADIYSEQNKITQAIELRNKSVGIYRKTGDFGGLAYELLQLAQLEIDNNSLVTAKQHLNQSIELSHKLKLMTIEQDGLRTLSGLLERQGDKSGALFTLKKFLALQELALSEKKKELEGDRTINSGVNKQLQQIELLEMNSEINDKTIEILRKNEQLNKKTLQTQIVVIFSLTGILLLVAVLGYLMYRNIQQKKVANQLLALKSLRSQMNPHFIFNALNSVNHYIAQKDERAANKYLSEFSRLMRAVLEHSQKDFISLQVETEIMALYLKLEQDRFRDKFEYILIVDPLLQKDAILIPPMLVQPFVENAIWHGLRYRETQGELYVRYELVNEKLIITIDDDGIGRKRSQQLKTENQKKNTSTAIMNISKRVEIINDMFGTCIEVDIYDKTDDLGTQVRISIDPKTE